MCTFYYTFIAYFGLITHIWDVSHTFSCFMLCENLLSKVLCFIIQKLPWGPANKWSINVIILLCNIKLLFSWPPRDQLCFPVKIRVCEFQRWEISVNFFKNITTKWGKKKKRGKPPPGFYLLECIMCCSALLDCTSALHIFDVFKKYI